MTQKNIVVLGSVNLDHAVQSPRLPQQGETIMGHSYQQARGGKGANQAVAAARLGAKPSFIACVGDDAAAHEAVESFRSDGINTDHVRICEGESTGVALILVDSEGHNCISIAQNANAKLSADVVGDKQEVIQQADYLLMQLETPLDGIERAVEIASQANTRIVLNPAPARPLDDELLSQLYLITPNETEAEILTGVKVTDTATAQQAAELLASKGVEMVIITMGAQGAYLYQQGQGELIPGFRVEAKDTTAAGDTFNGALLVALSRGDAMKDAIRFAHKASALSVTRMGAQSSIPYPDELTIFDDK
ncbi:ribokinase [Dongshaea marina]|uniref:ribokinase n=1 Tax=Dongshaea marina TaxID=2047966 RepID=UPI000D3E3527|nr:ribokinase [Dongshaea marina]